MHILTKSWNIIIRYHDNGTKKAETTKIIDRSLKRLGVERLDLVQFAWWDYQFPRYVETAVHLADLQKQGKIRFIGVTNFDAAHLQEILDAEIRF